MRTRHAVATAAHWGAVTALALLFADTAPFTGLYATATSVVIAAGVGLVGIAAAPHQKGSTK
ncbi:hypothetical protein [Streptomyces scabiei]|uniref:hypothetical protein n=1 Tax=Streptomyces scabiei TaxID=1930 RepID=UPI001B31453F|nr:MULTISPECIES: hypothetical protein [Streptomyces]MBP5870911.1 hypothetical protein [Streptomyces sp. LBUM 1485]MDX2532344.1 hypothetical protein [Streptomyces scabiei]MDX2794648.1 hypothetical protein [Streptomyces scabiei]MDX3822350.1 hypothetical protein [Streptomyces scabiei]QTU57395.1 hypothetical protein F3K21_35230 [Streptomyces sp. LBUM 1480]